MEKKDEGELNLKGNQYIWVVGAIIVLIAGWFGFRAIMTSFEDYKVTLIDSPKEIIAGGIGTFTWRVDGPPTSINHTSVHLGTESNPGILDKKVKPEETKYSDFIKDFADGKYDIPLQFIGNIRLDNPGTYYFRVHAQVRDKHYWSDEYSFSVAPSDYRISLVNAPSEAIAGATVTFTWRVDGLPTTINQTAVHLGTVSNPGALGKDVAPTDTKYTETTKDFLKGKYNIPLQFVGNQTILREGKYFYRIHALIEGKNYWTDEYTLEVKPKPTVTPME